MKIAIATDDGKTVSQHFGMAPYYLVVTIEDCKVVGREMRDKASHAQTGGAVVHGAGGHHDEGLHGRMAAAIPDCEAMLVGGMGAPARQGIIAAGIKPVIAKVTSVDDAIAGYLAGTLEDQAPCAH
jgi:predicted Fe-Mo cluster-binding NifX family protein